MKKIINPCTVKTLKSEEVDAFCKISFENNKLRIHGVVGPILGSASMTLEMGPLLMAGILK